MHIKHHYFLTYSHSTIDYHLNSNYYEGGSYTLDGSAAKDVYNLEINDYSNKNKEVLYDNAAVKTMSYPNIQVNNDPNYSYYADKIVSPKYTNNSNIHNKLHFSQFNGISLKKTNQIVVRADMYSTHYTKERDNAFSSTRPIWHKAIFLSKNKINQDSAGIFGEVFRFDSIVKIHSSEKKRLSTFVIYENWPQYH